MDFDDTVSSPLLKNSHPRAMNDPGAHVPILADIVSVINRFSGEERDEITEFYVKEATRQIVDPRPIRKSKIMLMKHISQFTDDPGALETRILHMKAIQTRALVLDLVTTNYSMEKRHISKPEKWILAILDDINRTFSEEHDAKLLGRYNEFLCQEIEQIFCSCEKFNTAGNQLLLNMICYRDEMQKRVSYDFGRLLKKLSSHFNDAKRLSLDVIEQVYVEYNKKRNAE